MITIAAGDQAVIPLFDTARFKVIADDNIVYELCGSDDGVLEAGELANVTITAVQL